MEEERDLVVFSDDEGNEFELEIVDYFDMKVRNTRCWSIPRAVAAVAVAVNVTTKSAKANTSTSTAQKSIS